MTGLDLSGLFGAGGISDENAAAFLRLWPLDRPDT